MMILPSLGIKRTLLALPFVIISKIVGARNSCKLLFRILRVTEGIIDYVSMVNEPENLHPRHRLIKYYEYFSRRIKASDRVLDIGCGNGFVACQVAVATGAVVLGIDINAEGIKSAREHYRYDNLSFAVGDACNMNMENTEFNVIILSNVLEHIKDRHEFLCRLKNTLRPERVLIRVPVYNRHWHVKMQEELGIDSRLDATHYIEYTKDTFFNEISEAGFTIRECEYQWGEIWAELNG
ncbi:MAG: hypothetical protein A2293_06830 [Elusimicrobia bacterium RIFOXYB2_FULL_49_7]|nr:MAG: hypothetical protein A2293_06830 [Elusimicrobia bacterium RIFOXYB2_FULL_49_7]